MPLEQLQPQNQAPTSSATLPSEQKAPEAPKKKHHFGRNLLITLVVIIILVAVAASVTGLYAVPGISNIVGMNKPKDLGIKSSPEALASLKGKIPMTISGPAADYSGSPEKIFTGQIPVDTNRSSEEITSWINRFSGTNPPVKDVQVKFIEGGMEISGMISEYVKAPVYVKVMVTQTSPTSVALDIQKAKLGLFSVPDKYLSQAQKWIQDKVNERIAGTPGYSIQTLEYHDGYSYFKGTYPKNVAPSTKGWSALLE